MEVRIEEKRLGGRPVLGALGFSLGPHEAAGLLGPSGIGKTTLLRIIAGLDTDFRGHVAGAGRIGFVFQEPTLLPWRTVRDNIVLAARVSAEAAGSLLREVGLGRHGDAFPGALSLGEARRVALARALAVEPETLLLDEPFVSLDPDGALRMQRVVERLMDAHPMRTILVTHRAEECARLTDRVFRLGGAPARIVAEQSLALPRRERDEPWIRAAADELASPLSGNGG